MPPKATKPTLNSNGRMSIADIIGSVNKTFGTSSICRLGDDGMQCEFTSTGALSVDIALGVAGLPNGRIIEIFGPESSGKTTMALSVIAEGQRQGKNAVFIDLEHALDPKWAARCGVDVDNLLVSQPDDGETALQIVQSLIELKVIDIIVVDSVAALVTKAELAGQIGDSHVGQTARLMSQCMRKLVSLASNNNTTIIFINQIREKVGVVYGSPETTPGGRALKFFASVRLDIRRIESFKSPDGKQIGCKTKVKVIKNKVAPPFREATFSIMFDEGLSRESSIIELGVEYRILDTKGSWISYNGQLLGQGHAQVREHLRKNPHLTQELRTLILDKAGIKPGVVDQSAASADTDEDEYDDDIVQPISPPKSKTKEDAPVITHKPAEPKAKAKEDAPVITHKSAEPKAKTKEDAPAITHKSAETKAPAIAKVLPLPKSTTNFDDVPEVTLTSEPLAKPDF